MAVNATKSNIAVKKTELILFLKRELKKNTNPRTATRKNHAKSKDKPNSEGKLLKYIPMLNVITAKIASIIDEAAKAESHLPTYREDLRIGFVTLK
jgi:hypothetical protein